jgi:hypothetical protein
MKSKEQIISPDTDAIPPIRPTTSQLTPSDHWDHFLTRIGYRREQHRVTPGLYSLGSPTPDSPVFVTANYTLSFDALRGALGGIDAYLLVLDTNGINVWCAAGKGTFGTDELVRRIEETRLSEVVRHRILILPQLGAPGVSAHEVKKRSKFKVEYGPVRAADLPAYLQNHEATPEMRQVRFTLRDRSVLIPVEFVHIVLPLAVVAAILWYWSGGWGSLGWFAAVVTGVVLFPILLPWLPTPNFSTKGFILGGLVALPFAARSLLAHPETAWWLRIAGALATLLLLPPITAYISLNFTGSSTFTSRTGVRREMFTYLRMMAILFGAGLVLTVTLWITQAIGV